MYLFKIGRGALSREVAIFFVVVIYVYLLSSDWIVRKEIKMLKKVNLMSIMMKNSFTTIFLQKIQGNKRKWEWCFTNFSFILTKHSRENNRKIIIFFFFISICFSHNPNWTGACNNFYQKILYKFYFVLRVCVCAHAQAQARVEITI